MRTLLTDQGPFNPQFSGMLAVSAIAHAVLFALLLFTPWSAPEPFGMAIPAEIVKGIPLSPAPKGTPESTNRVAVEEEKKADPAAPEKKETVKPAAPAPPTPPKKDEMTLPVKNPTKRQKEPEKEKIERKATIDSALERIRRKKANERASEQFGDPEGVAGTQAYQGMGGMQDRIINLYLAKIKEKVERNWVRPTGIPSNADVKVRIFFRIDSSGGIVQQRIEKSSGYALADRSAMAALQKSVPFDAPPPTVAGKIRREGIALIFELSDL